MGFGVALQFITGDHFVIAIKDAVLTRFTVEDLNAYPKIAQLALDALIPCSISVPPNPWRIIEAGPGRAGAL